MKELPETGPKVLIQHNGDATDLVQNTATTIEHKEVGKINLSNDKVNY